MRRASSASVGYWSTLAAYYSVAAGMAFAAARWLATTAAVVLLVVEVAAMAVVTFFALLYEEDWWNDCREQTRSMVLGLVANVIGVCAAAWLGFR